jgi:hypothetical protein
MKRRSVLFIVPIIVLGFAIFGLWMKKTYTDFSSEKDYMDQLQIAEIPEQICLSTCQRMCTELPEVSIIVRVSPIDELENLFGVSRQKVVIKEVYKGANLAVGEEIYLTSEHWNLIVRQDRCAMGRGFINVLKPHLDYLTFISGEVDCFSKETPVYRLFDGERIAPVFCYEDIDNLIVEPTDGNTYVPYSSVKNNEFFSTTNSALNAWISLKHDMINQFPLS